ncbi:MAG: DUF692 domain-containing protein [Myxococcales bacterium]|nr:DUF692 domain-containing protein [Myxococcales bacterium]
MSSTERSLNGVGLGLRWEFLEEVLAAPELGLAFWEICPENYMHRGGYYPYALGRIAEREPVVTHGLTLSIGGSEPAPLDYLHELRDEIRRVGAPWHSDHLCFGNAGPRMLHELLPLKQSSANAQRAAERLRRARDVLGVPVLVENITWYAHPGRREMPEADFITEVVERAETGLLLDVNNVWVNAQNHGFEPRAFIRALPLDRVRQIHVAGHTRTPSGLILDTHGEKVVDPVIDLLGFTLEHTGPMPVLLERDNQVPELPELLDEVGRLRAAYDRAMTRREAPLARSA